MPENDRIMIRAKSCSFEKWCGLVFFMMWLLAACDVNLFMRSDATSQSWFCCLALNAPTIRVNTFREIQARTEPKVDFCLFVCSRIRSWCGPGPALVLLPDNGICICREFDFCNSINKPNHCWLLFLRALPSTTLVGYDASYALQIHLSCCQSSYSRGIFLF